MIMAGSVLQGDGFSVSFSNREVTAWGELALFKQMLDSLGFREAVSGWGLPEPKSNRGYPPRQLIEQFIVSIGCGACRFAHAETVRMDGTLVRRGRQATRPRGHKAIMRLFGRFDMLTNEWVQAEACRWLFSKISALRQVTLDVDSTVVTRNGEQEGATRGYNPNRHGRTSHHPLLAFVAEARMVANFWLRPGMSIAPTTSCNCSNRPCIIWATRSLGCHVPTAASSMKPSWRSWKVSASPTSLPPA